MEYWKNEIKLDDTFISSNKKQIKYYNNEKYENEKRVFLLGSTGFLGAYMLTHLLKLTNCSVVYCLVRNKKKLNNPLDDILNNLKQHKLFEQLNENQLLKIEIINGDLRKSKFGMSPFDYKEIHNDINLIINSAANMNLESNYEKIKLINVNGVKEMIKLSISVEPPIKVVFISSFSVFNNFKLKKQGGEEFNEEIQFPDIENIGNESCGYIQSKIVSEYLLMNASNKFNIPSMIIRAPVLFANPYTNIGSLELFTTTFLASHAIGYYPTLDINVLVSTITWSSSNIMNVILNEECWKLSKSPISKLTSIYNINGDIQTISNLFESTIKKLGCKEIPFDQWCDLVKDSNHFACKRYIYLKINKFLMLFKIDKSLNISKKTKSILQTMGAYGNGNSSGVDDKMIISTILYYNDNNNNNNSNKGISKL